MEARPFPGAPENISQVLSKTLFDASLELENHGNERSKKMAQIYEGLSLCLLAPRAYFDLFMKIGPHYQEMQDFWNHKVYMENGGVLGSKKRELINSSDVSADLSIVNDIPADPFNILVGCLSLTQDEESINSIPNVSETIKEQIYIFNQILWAVYIGAFKSEFFDIIHSIFSQSIGEAHRELNRDRKDLN